MFGAGLAISRLHLRICPKCDNFTLTKAFNGFSGRGVQNFNINQFKQVTRNFGNWRSFVFIKSWRANIIGYSRRHQHTPSTASLIKHLETIKVDMLNPMRINTKVTNNVLLYKMDKDVLLRSSLLFGIVATIACLFMADNVYLILCKDLFNESTPLKERLYNHILPIAAITVGILAGPLIVSSIWFLTIRSVKYIVLHKGGDSVTIVTYHPMKKFRKMTVPLSHIDCRISRKEDRNYSMIKIKNIKYQFVIDKDGVFINPELYDGTVGAARNQNI